MPTQQQVYEFMDARIEEGSAVAAQAALQHFAATEAAASALLHDVLGARALSQWFNYVQHQNRQRTHSGEEPFFHQGHDRIYSVPLIRIYEQRYGVGQTRLADMTEEKAVAYAQSFDRTALVAAAQARFWRWLGGQLGSRRFEDVYPTETQAKAVMARLQRMVNQAEQRAERRSGVTV